jgi:hypothetical protein
MVWTTRWMSDAVGASPFYVLDAANKLTPGGEALRAWGAYARPDLLATDGNAGGVDVFAARRKDGGAMTVWILNRGLVATDVALKIDGPAYRILHGVRFSGSGELDSSPKWETLPEPIAGGPQSIPPLSLTILTLKAPPRNL